VDGFVVPRSDEYLGEYVDPSGERLAWISGFSGSAGLAVITRDRAILFTDGRYTTQAAAQTDPALWDREHLIDAPPADWLRRHAGGLRIGYDPWLHGEAALKRLAAGADLVPLAANPIDALWNDRPAPPAARPVAHPIELAGETSASKRAALAAELRSAGEAACLLADPHSVAWLPTASAARWCS
jgi:Xaa-Pro aminopeptidase